MMTRHSGDGLELNDGGVIEYLSFHLKRSKSEDGGTVPTKRALSPDEENILP
jgi:hypothetical protein